ncbi:hypothetical protein Cgig2_017171 [Carnegiea gigantea]|uniref:BHLH domain-containing protein n=1 Tax=Carnegiea gigantea TaxID=171969 RepID=A0A9Q1QF78_9CARY|nr:hypothetical protein Cgig2_017171 [Carnegiea gigantea]
MEGGEWSSFNAVCVNEEADFMAQLFPNPSNVDHLTYSNAENGSYYSSDSPNLYYFSSQESSYNANKSSHDSSSYNSFLSDSYHDHHHQQALSAAASNASSLPIDFLQCQIEGDNANRGSVNMEETTPMDLISEDKNSDSSNNAKKRPRVSDAIPRGKRNVRPKRGQKFTEGVDEEDENEGGVNGQSSSSRSGTLQDDCSSKGTNTTSSALNSNGKTRASRGSATDPQSLYARKRRERINERLRILQSLVPNGTKVDISTMLEEAVHYVKFLQLQIKLLSSDDLWMYAPIAYNGMNIGLDFKINLPR